MAYMPLPDPLLPSALLILAIVFCGMLHVETAAIATGMIVFTGDATPVHILMPCIGTAIVTPLRRTVLQAFSPISYSDIRPDPRIAVEFPIASLNEALQASSWRTMPSVRLVFAVLLRSALWSTVISLLTMFILERTTQSENHAREILAGLLLLAPVAAVTLRSVIGRCVRHLFRN